MQIICLESLGKIYESLMQIVVFTVNLKSFTSLALELLRPSIVGIWQHSLVGVKVGHAIFCLDDDLIHHCN